MKTLSVLKKDLEFNKSLSSLIETLKTIAVSQYKTLEQRIRTFEELLVTIESFFEFIDIERIDHAFLNPGNKPQAVVAVTTDTGLLGGLNMKVVEAARAELEKIPGKLVVIGGRGKIYVKEGKIPYAAFGGIRDDVRYGQAMQVRDYLVSEVLKGVFGHIKVIFPRPVSFTVQRVETVSFLPYSRRVTGKSGGRKIIHDILMESRPKDMVEYLVRVWMGQKLYEIFGMSRLAEFAARYVHLEESAQKLKDIDKKTHLEYFRVQHELIDRNMRELFAARLLYARA